MLLIDRLMEIGAQKLQGCIEQRDPHRGTKHAVFLRTLASAAVFDITGCIDTLKEVISRGDLAKPISDFGLLPCTPPAPTTWTEWGFTDGAGVRCKYGSLITHSCIQEQKDIDGCLRRTPFMAMNFFCPEAGPSNRSCMDGNYHGLICQEDDGTRTSLNMLTVKGLSESFDLVSTIPGSDGYVLRAFRPKPSTWVPLDLFVTHETQDNYQLVESPMLAFAGFALLACKNVETETHEPCPKQARRLAKYGQPPRVTYKTLRLVVPDYLKEHAGPGEGDGQKKRLHFVRGHFKNLQHERYKDKRGMHWWPSHWRGDASVGRVEKRYEVHGEGA